MLRYTLDKLKNLGYMKECNKKVDINFEIGSVLKYFDNEVPIKFNNIRGYNTSLVGALYGNRNIIYNLILLHTL